MKITVTLCIRFVMQQVTKVSDVEGHRIQRFSIGYNHFLLGLMVCSNNFSMGLPCTVSARRPITGGILIHPADVWPHQT